MKQKLLSAVLAILLMLGAVPAAAAEPDTNSGTPTQAPVCETAAPTEVPTEAPTQAPVLRQRSAVKPAPTAENDFHITAAAPSLNGMKLSWTAYPKAAKYMVFIRRPDNSGWKKIGEAAATSFEQRDPVSNTTYTYTVRAADKKNRFLSGLADPVSFRYLSAPEITGADSIAAGQRLKWNSVTGAKHYRVYLKTDGRWNLIGTAKTNSFLNRNAVAGRTYTYTVRCWDNTNRILLSYFDAAGFSAVHIGAPQITGVNAAKNGVTVSWNPAAGASSYAVFGKTGGKWKKLGVTAKTAFTDTALSYDTEYTYTVRSLDSEGRYAGGWNTAGVSLTYLKPPVVTSVAYRDGKYTVSWRARGNAASSRIFRKEYGGKWKYVGASDSNTFTDTTAKKEGVYTYTVRSMDANDQYMSFYTESDRYYCMGLFIIGSLGAKAPNTHPLYTCEVTEEELRMIMAKTAAGWMGAVEGDSVHKDILSYYNQYTPLPGGYVMQTHDAWCAAFVSAVWIRSGVAPYTGVECGCGRFIDVAVRNHSWVEEDSYLPKVGDAVIYNWSDSGYGECKSGADHIGIVTSVRGNKFTVTEGNTGNGIVGTRELVVNNRFIRGFIAPNYQQIAAFLSMKARYM